MPMKNKCTKTIAAYREKYKKPVITDDIFSTDSNADVPLEKFICKKITTNRKAIMDSTVKHKEDVK